MPYLRSVPNNRIEPLAYLGKHDWLTLSPRGFNYSKSRLQALLDGSLRFGRDFANQVRDIINLSISPHLGSVPGSLPAHQYAHLFYVASKVLSTGQKTIRLTTDWCEAFEETELTLRFADYRQPFPTMVVELPPGYAQEKLVPGSADYPECLAVHFDEQVGVLLVEIVLKNSQTHLTVPSTPDLVLEDVLKSLLVTPSREADYTESPGVERYLAGYIRIALNAVVSMVYGTEWEKLAPTYSEQQAKRKLKQRAKSQDAATSGRARLRLAAQPDVFQFQQTIRAFDVEPAQPSGEAEGAGAPKKPHWRRGHWRRQPVGQGRAGRELRWIRPVLVNADRFKGDLKDTTTTYQAGP